MMSTRSSKHVEAWNKYIKKECVKLVIDQKQKIKFLISQYSRSSNYQWQLILNNVVQTNDTKFSDTFTAAFVNTVTDRSVVITTQNSTCRQPEINGHDVDKMVAKK
jgi:S-adenosylmethionine synthetase